MFVKLNREQQRISSTWVISEKKLLTIKELLRQSLWLEAMKKTMKYRLIHQLQQKAPSEYFLQSLGSRGGNA